MRLPEKQCCIHALGTNACTKLSRSSPLCCIYMFMFMIRTQEVYTLLIMKLAEHIYRPILSKSCFSCVLPLLLVNVTIAQFKATLHYYSISGFYLLFRWSTIECPAFPPPQHPRPHSKQAVSSQLPKLSHMEAEVEQVTEGVQHIRNRLS